MAPYKIQKKEKQLDLLQAVRPLKGFFSGKPLKDQRIFLTIVPDPHSSVDSLRVTLTQELQDRGAYVCGVNPTAKVEIWHLVTIIDAEAPCLDNVHNWYVSDMEPWPEGGIKFRHMFKIIIPGRKERAVYDDVYPKRRLNVTRVAKLLTRNIEDLL